eukprot:Em0006g1163a
MSGLFSDAMRDINVRIVVGITNVLTIVGSVFILVSYLCFPSLRTGARLILLHLSLMDLVVGLAHFVGGYTMYWDQHVSNTTFCKAQAFVGYYSIISSVLWTVCLSAYMYCLSSRVTAARTNSGYIRYHIWPSCAVCYGIPLILAFWALRTGRLGYSPYDAAGWCSIVTRTTSRDDFFASAFGFDVWIYLAMILITILYVSSHCFRRLHRSEDGPRAMDYKFVFIPVVFIFLRMWTCILDLLFYMKMADDLPHGLVFALIFLSGIGDSAQGFANTILFVCFTKTVRDAFRKSFCPCGYTQRNWGLANISRSRANHLA